MGYVKQMTLWSGEHPDQEEEEEDDDSRCEDCGAKKEGLILGDGGSAEHYYFCEACNDHEIEQELDTQIDKYELTQEIYDKLVSGGKR
jgi:hypothetical protein